MTYFDKSQKSLQSLWNVFKTLLKGFLTASATVCVDLAKILERRKLAAFEQKAWAIAHGFEHGRFYHVMEIAPKSLELPQNSSEIISDCFRDCLCRFSVNSNRCKIGRFWAKPWAIAHGFEHGWFRQVPESLQNLWNASKTLLKGFLTAFATVCVDLVRIREGRKLAVFRAKGLGYSPWFWRWPILKCPGNLSKLSGTSPKTL